MHKYLLILLLVNSTAFAATTIKVTDDLFRTDETPITQADIKDYTILYGRSPDALINQAIMPNKGLDINTHEFTDLENGMNYFAVITNDTGGRSSAISKTVFKNETEGVTVVKPDYPDFTITRIGDGLDYSLTFPTIDNSYKYYLFNDGKYVTEIRQSNYDTAIPFVLHLDAKDYNWTMEYESKINGINISSDRSPIQSMTAGVEAPVIPPVVVPPVEPPVIGPPVIEPPINPTITFDIPEGATKGTITFK